MEFYLSGNVHLSTEFYFYFIEELQGGPNSCIHIIIAIIYDQINPWLCFPSKSYSSQSSKVLFPSFNGSNSTMFHAGGDQDCIQ